MMNLKLKLAARRTRKHVDVNSLEHASETLIAFQDQNGVRSSDMRAGHGEVTCDGRVVAKISYNGRIHPVESRVSDDILRDVADGKKPVTMEDVQRNIELGVYESDPTRFQDDACEAVGIKGNPKAGTCFSKAYQRGHAYGYAEVLSILDDLSELVK